MPLWRYGGLTRSTCVVVQETPTYMVQRHAQINDLIQRALIRAEIAYQQPGTTGS